MIMISFWSLNSPKNIQRIGDEFAYPMGWDAMKRISFNRVVMCISCTEFTSVLSLYFISDDKLYCKITNNCSKPRSPPKALNLWSCGRSGNLL